MRNLSTAFNIECGASFYPRINFEYMIKKIAAGVLLIIATTQTNAQTDALQERKMQSFLRYVGLAYVDSVDSEALVEKAIKNVLEDLDPHSVYISAEDLKRANEPLEGNFEGVGIQFNIVKDTIIVVSAIPGGPSEELGILAGDKIVTIEDSTVAGVGFTNKDVADNLRGKKGTKVKVGIKRGNQNELIYFTVTRDKIPIYSVDAGYMAQPGIGYIKLNRFAATSMDEISSAMDSLKEQGMEHLILDLRGNSGGYLQTAIELADQFLNDKKLIVYTEGRSYPRDDKNATNRGTFLTGKIVVLIDEGSASASEIVSGAIQDWDRGIIIGRRSFGKGLVQKPFSLADGSAIRLTISRYYTPAGRSIQRPYENGKKDYYREVYNRFNTGEMVSMDSITLPDSLAYETKLNKRTVYGGGGIMPDIFVPLDTTGGSDYYGQVARKGILNEFSILYLDKNRKKLKRKYAGLDDYIENFDVASEVLPAFIEHAAKEGVEENNEEIEKSSEWINNALKGLIARGVWGTGSYTKVNNQTDEAYLKAIGVINGDYFDRWNISYK